MSYSTTTESLHQHPLYEVAQNHPSNTALVYNNHSLNFHELLAQAKSVTMGMVNRGLKTKDVIILHQLTPADTILGLWACFLGGFIPFPVNSRFPVETLKQITQPLKPTLCISSESISWCKSVKMDILKTAGLNPGPPDFDIHAPATLLMTSGSGGVTRVVQHTYMNHISSASGSNQNIPLSQTDKWLLALPLYHIGGLSILFRSMLSGAAIVLPDTNHGILASIQSHRVTHISLVVTQMQRLLETAGAIDVLRGMKAILLGGSAIPKSLIEKLLNLNIPVHVSYGSTEMASQITTTSSENRSWALNNSGKLLKGRDLIISHEGEILVKGDTLAQGYRQGAIILSFRDESGWFHTGDVGYMDVKGALTVTGRMDNQFISGGENIQPEYIEAMLCKLEGIANAVILPRPDSEFGYRPVAYIQMESSFMLRDEINDHLRNSLPGYMIPIDYFLLPDEIVSQGLKISRQSLAEMVDDKNKHLQELK